MVRLLDVTCLHIMPVPSQLDFVLADLDEGVAESYSLADLPQLEDLVNEYIHGDVYAIVMNGEVVYDVYQQLTYRERILEYAVREQIMRDPHRHLFVPLLRRQQPFTLEVWMFAVADTPWKIIIQYDPYDEVFSLTQMVSI